MRLRIGLYLLIIVPSYGQLCLKIAFLYPAGWFAGCVRSDFLSRVFDLDSSLSPQLLTQADVLNLSVRHLVK